VVQVAPAKPDYVIERKVLEEKRRMKEKQAQEEEQKDKRLKKQIKETEEKLQRRRVRTPIHACHSHSTPMHVSSPSQPKQILLVQDTALYSVHMWQTLNIRQFSSILA
jgi:hypothetical protein